MASTRSAAPSISALHSVAARSSSSRGGLVATDRQRRRAVEVQHPELARAVHGRHGVGSPDDGQIHGVGGLALTTTTATSADGA